MQNEWEQQVILEMNEADNHYIQWYQMNENINSFAIIRSCTLRQLMLWIRTEYPVLSRDICLAVSLKIKYNHSVIAVKNLIKFLYKIFQ